MIPRFLFIAWFLPVLIYVCPIYADVEAATGIEDLKSGVVKITASVEGKRKMGTGMIVNLNEDEAYILTASHVIEGDPSPKIYFYSKRDEAYSGKIIGLEGGDPKGLAALLVRGGLPTGIRALDLSRDLNLNGGESITLIGFPRFLPVQWAISKATFTGQANRDLIFSGAAANEGNSGGPILVNNKVVGVLTEVQGDFGYGVPSAIFQIALKNWGVQIEQPGISTQPSKKPTTIVEELVVPPIGGF